MTQSCSTSPSFCIVSHVGKLIWDCWLFSLIITLVFFMLFVWWAAALCVLSFFSVPSFCLGRCKYGLVWRCSNSTVTIRDGLKLYMFINHRLRWCCFCCLNIVCWFIATHTVHFLVDLTNKSYVVNYTYALSCSWDHYNMPTTSRKNVYCCTSKVSSNHIVWAKWYVHSSWELSMLIHHLKQAIFYRPFHNSSFIVCHK